MRSPRTSPLLASAGLLLAAATGCTAAETRPAPEPTSWSEPDRYTYRLLSTSGDRPGTGDFQVTVDRGKVVKALGLDDGHRHTVERNPREIPTLSGLLTRVAEARAAHADVARTMLAADGHPTEVHIDWLKKAIDDEADYFVTEYRVLTS